MSIRILSKSLAEFIHSKSDVRKNRIVLDVIENKGPPPVTCYPGFSTPAFEMLSFPERSMEIAREKELMMEARADNKFNKFDVPNTVSCLNSFARMVAFIALQNYTFEKVPSTACLEAEINGITIFCSSKKRLFIVREGDSKSLKIGLLEFYLRKQGYRLTVEAQKTLSAINMILLESSGVWGTVTAHRLFLVIDTYRGRIVTSDGGYRAYRTQIEDGIGEFTDRYNILRNARDEAS